MARGNLFQGMAHGALGDVTFQRKNGMQVSSVRVRQQTNPESTQQCYQRTCFATVVQAYAAGREIFDHSFEGCTTPADNQAKFYSLNVARLKDALLNGAAQHTEWLQDGFRFVAPHVSWPVPSTFRISQGSLPDGSESFRIGGTYNHYIEMNYEYFINVQTLGDFIRNWPYDETVMFTVCSFAAQTLEAPVFEVPANIAANDVIHCNSQYKCNFNFFRFKRKPLRQISSRIPIRTAVYGDAFDIECSKSFEDVQGRILRHLLRDNIFFFDMNNVRSYNGSWGIIRSDVNDGRRSTCDMKIVHGATSVVRKAFGLSGGYIADAWRTEAPSIATP